jgi:Na+-transporting NADH:ubiquinone oxidoreductase subunit C
MTTAEGTPRILLVALGVALVCSLMVSTAVELLRPVQLAFKAIDRNRVIVKAAGLVSTKEHLSDREIVDRFQELEVRVVDLAAGRFTDAVDALSYDQRAAAQDPQLSAPIEPSQDLAGLGHRARYALVYLLMDGQSIRRLVVPVHGQGMWSTIYGYVALEGDLTTVADIVFFEHGETAGIGDQIEGPRWRGSWQGKQIYDQTGQPALAASSAASGSAPEHHRVDAIAGATVTVDGVMNTVRYWFGGDGFGPFLRQLRPAQAQAAQMPEE